MYDRVPKRSFTLGEHDLDPAQGWRVTDLLVFGMLARRAENPSESAAISLHKWASEGRKELP